MIKARGSPKIPRNLIEAAETLDEYAPMRGFYKGLVRGADGSAGLIFINDRMMPGLQKCTQLYIDGTFKVQ